MLKINAEYLGDLRVKCMHEPSGVSIITDAPLDNNGKGQAFSPTDLCAAALGSCAMTIIGIYARQHNVDVTGARLEINKIMGADPRKIARIEVIFHMPPKNYADKQKIAIERAARSCPVSLTLGENVEQIFDFRWQDDLNI